MIWRRFRILRRLNLFSCVVTRVWITPRRLRGVLFPGPLGACALLPKVTDQLRELKSRKTIDGQDFPGSTMLFSPYQRCNWMMEICQIRLIGQIVWPGTHKSATNDIGLHFITRPFRQHQTLSIYHQLRNGVRVLDIRVQQDRRVCNGSLLSYNIDLVITDIKRFLAETQFEIVIIEIRTECGYTDPPNFESYLVAELGDFLIHQDDHVFLKSISQVLPRRIICIWKPKNSPRPKLGGPIWSASYLRDDKFETELPLTKLEEPISKRINGFARHFLAKCNTQGVLDRLQIYTIDFVDDDFIITCIGLNHARDIQLSRPVIEMGNNTTTDSNSSDNTTDSSNKNNTTGSSSSSSDNNKNNTTDTSNKNNTTGSSSNNTFMVFARDLYINWVEDNSYWKWSYLTETPSNVIVEVADLLQVTWLKLIGKFNTEKLHQGIKYEVAFVVMLKDSANGLDIPVNLLLILPDGSTQRNQEILNHGNSG